MSWPASLRKTRMFRRTVPVDDSSNRSHRHDPDGCSMHNVPRSDTRSSRGPVEIPVRHLAVCRLYTANPSTKPAGYAADRFAPHGKRILVEALSPGVKPHYLFSSQYQALAIVEEVARDNVFIQLDTFHAQKVDGNLTHLIRNYAGKYAHVQIAGLPDRHEPDDGEINYPWLFRLFDEVGYQGWIGCEYKPRGLTKEGLGWFDAWR